MTVGSPTSQTMTRRSTRVRARIPILITSLDPAITCSLLCETLIVNAHGCAAKAPQRFAIGMPVRLRIREGSEATARIVDCQPLGESPSQWVVGIELDKPGNIWGLTPSPEDWARLDRGAAQSEAGAAATGRPTLQLKMPVWPLASPSTRIALPARASDEELKKELAAQQETIASLEDRLATSIESLPGVVRQQLLEAQQQILAPAREQLITATAELVHAQLAPHGETIAKLKEELATSLESVPDTVRKQLADAQQETLAQARRQFGAMLAESAQGQSTAQADAIAKLQERLTSLESMPGKVREQLADAQQQTLAQVRKQLGAALAEFVRPLQEELAVCRKKAEDAQQIRAAVAEQFEQLPWQIEQHAHAAFRPLQERARADLEGIIAAARSQDERDTAGQQALQASAEALQKELAQARTSLESSTQSLPVRIQAPIAAAVEDALARAHATMSAALARELEALHARGRMVADELRAAAESLRSERAATRAQIQEAGAQREELRLWLAEQQASYTKQVGRQLEQLASELAMRSAGVLEEQIKSDIEVQAERAEADLNQRLAPMLNRADDVRQEVLSLLGTLQRESDRCETQVRALLEEKDGVEAWITERAADFQRTFHDALVETTGQIKGRLQMAVEMITQPVEKLRDQAAQQLQEQAGRQVRQLREYGDEAAERLRGLQRDIETAVRESLRAQAAETSATFGREIAQQAQRSVEEWRSALARNLASIANLLGQKLPGGEG